MVISNLINYFVNLLSKFRYAKSVLLENADLLADGVYKANKNMTQIYEKGYYKYAYSESQYQFDNLDGNRERKPFLIIKKLLSSLFTFKVKTENKYFHGKLVNITSMHGNVKVFDFENNKLISVFKDENILTRTVEKRNYWGMYFKVPSFEVHQDNHLFIEEQILEKEKFDVIEMLSSVIDDYVQYFSRITPVENPYIDKEKINCFSSLFNIDEKEIVSYMLSPEYKECVVHGDLWYANIIYSKGQKYYIDFENVGQRVFYYDILLYIFTSWKLGDDSMLRMYCNGRLDQELNRLFKGMNIIFEPSKKKVMFLTFLFFYYVEFWQGRITFERRLCELVLKIKNI